MSADQREKTWLAYVELGSNRKNAVEGMDSPNCAVGYAAARNRM
jgi:hypothetical protein